MDERQIEGRDTPKDESKIGKKRHEGYDERLEGEEEEEERNGDPDVTKNPTEAFDKALGDHAGKPPLKSEGVDEAFDGVDAETRNENGKESNNFNRDDYSTRLNASAKDNCEEKTFRRRGNGNFDRTSQDDRDAEKSEMKDLGKSDPLKASPLKASPLKASPVKASPVKASSKDRKPDETSIRADSPSDNVPEVRFSITKRRTTGSSGLGLRTLRSSRVIGDADSGSDFVSENSDSVFTPAKSHLKAEEQVGFMFRLAVTGFH